MYFLLKCSCDNTSVQIHNASTSISHVPSFPFLPYFVPLILFVMLMLPETLKVLRESKALVRNINRAALEQANERECEALKRVWGSPQGMDSMLKYLQKKIDEF